MSQFTLTIQTDGDAFTDLDGQYEIARILREAAENVEGCDEYGRLRDSNGNTVGSFSWTGR